MKRNLILWAMAALTGCFASCSQDEVIATADGMPQQVTVTAQMPGQTTTRGVGVDALVGENQLRCILSVINNTDKSEITRIEKLVSEEDTKISFTFTVDSKVDYSCLFWADYVAKDATATNGKYADEYFVTSNLQAISINASATDTDGNAKFFNNEASDAFCGVLTKTLIGETQTPSISLKRPFAKFNLKPNSEDEWATSITSMTVEFAMPGEYNMLTGKAEGAKTVLKATNVTREATAEANYFSTFLFVEDTENNKFNEDITLTFTDPENTSSTVTRTVRGGFSTASNNETNGSANLSSETDVTVDVDIDGDLDDPNKPADPKVGDFFYSDGTWSTTLDNEKACVGIIFDLAEGDDVANYPDAGLTDIKGWVVALKDAQTSDSKNPAWYIGTTRISNTNNAHLAETIDNVALLTSTGDNSVKNELKGYSNSKAISTLTDYADFPANEACKNYSSEVSGTSGWYMPSIGQLLRLHAAETNISTSFTTANGTEVNAGVYLSSTLYSTNSGTYTPLGIQCKSDESNYGNANAQKATSTYYVRPILTF